MPLALAFADFGAHLIAPKLGQRHSRRNNHEARQHIPCVASSSNWSVEQAGEEQTVGSRWWSRNDIQKRHSKKNKRRWTCTLVVFLVPGASGFWRWLEYPWRHSTIDRCPSTIHTKKKAQHVPCQHDPCLGSRVQV